MQPDLWTQELINEIHDLVNEARVAEGKPRWNFGERRVALIGDDRCKMCADLGFPDILAHYKGTPAGMSHTGKAIPALCWDHRNGRIPKHLEKLTQEQELRKRQEQRVSEKLRVHDVPSQVMREIARPPKPPMVEPDPPTGRTSQEEAEPDESVDPEILDARNNHGQGEVVDAEFEEVDEREDEREEEEPEMETEELCHCGLKAHHRGRHRTKKPSAPVKGGHPCACNCGTMVHGTQRYAYGHKSRASLAGVVVSPGTALATRNEPAAIENSMVVEHSVTRRTKVTVERSEIELGRRVTILVPRARPMTQVKLTPDIARVVWDSLSKEEKADLMDVEGLWDGYDDEMRMNTVARVLLIDPEEIPKHSRR